MAVPTREAAYPMNSSGTSALRSKDSGRPPDRKKVSILIEFPCEPSSVSKPRAACNDTCANEVETRNALVNSPFSRMQWENLLNAIVACLKLHRRMVTY